MFKIYTQRSSATHGLLADHCNFHDCWDHEMQEYQSDNEFVQCGNSSLLEANHNHANRKTRTNHHRILTKQQQNKPAVHNRRRNIRVKHHNTQVKQGTKPTVNNGNKMLTTWTFGSDENSCLTSDQHPKDPQCFGSSDHCRSQSNRKRNQNHNNNSRDVSNNEQKTESDCANRSGSELDEENERSTDDTVRSYMDSFPWASSIVCSHYGDHITRTSESNDTRYVFFDLDKSSVGHTCPFVEREHRRNNVYLKLDTHEQHLFLECHHPDCRSKSHLLAHCVSKNVYGLEFSDFGLADIFVRTSPTKYLSKVSKSGKRLTIFFFNRVCWEMDVQNTFLWRQLTTCFKRSLQSSVEEKLSRTDEKQELKQLQTQLYKIKRMLGSTCTADHYHRLDILLESQPGLSSTTSRTDWCSQTVFGT